MLVILDIQEFEIPEFYHFVEETSKAYNLAESSEHDIIVTTYRNMCENLIAGRLSQQFRALEDFRRFLEDRYDLSIIIPKLYSE
ncbi:43025_t:CDS:2 [Gigaspora margarita]|uniref:43025_t:CDS:1 n=1 Tax=Gigaspora margarita TaxID=4874 RepID=A0ABN7UF13_GIGMA|nr:43025_t:CDS:2 [Gigaspora margarita]